MTHEGLRYNTGKIRQDLLPPHAISEVAKVLTKGAEKYADRNWEKGMAWSTVAASLKRHLSDWENGKTIDPDDGCSLISKVATNALFLTEYEKTYPEGDDRRHAYLDIPKIGLDVDDVLADFLPAYCEEYRIPIPAHWNFDRKMGERLADLSETKDFYIGLSPKVSPEELLFEPSAYVTSRPIPSGWTQEWLDKNGFPVAPVVTVSSASEKVEAIKKLDIDVFVDDNFDTFCALNKAGVCCYLYDMPHNKRYDVGYKRITKLAELPWFTK